MNGFINPFKTFFKKATGPTVTEAEQNVPNESLSIPCEHSNRTPVTIQQNGDDDDYFVYKLDPDDDKWARWNMFEQKQSFGQGHFGLQISDTVKNSYIHVFPDRQDLVNPPVGNNPKYRGEAIPQHYFVENYYGTEYNNVGRMSPKNFVSSNENEKSKDISRILPTSILEDSGQSDNIYDVNQSHGGIRSQLPRASSDYQSYARAVPKARFEEKKSLEDFSMIKQSKKESAINLDESDDMSFAQVIKTLEKNIERSQAAKRYRPLASASKAIKGLKLFNIQKVRNQEDTLSLDQSSWRLNSSSMRLPTYPEEPKDLMTQFLKKGTEDNNTIYYSFASTENYDSFHGAISTERERILSNSNVQLITLREGRQASPNSKTITSKGSPNKLELARIEEEISSIRTPVKGTEKNKNRLFEANIEIREDPSVIQKGCKNCFSNAKPQRPKPEQVTAAHTRQPSHQKEQQRSPDLVLEAQPSENLVLCINCNDLLPSKCVDEHSRYCNESMLASEDLKRVIELEPDNLRLSLERCNLRLKKFKVLLEKNLWNLKGQLSLGLVSIDEPETVFSDMDLVLQIIEEILRNQKVPQKLNLDIRSIDNLKEDLYSSIDVTLINILLSNLEETLNKCRQKKTVIELIQKQDSIMQTPNEMDDSLFQVSGKRSAIPKVELERLRFSSLTSPQSITSNNPISHSQKPSFPTNYSQSTRGSTTNSRRTPLENRFLFSGEAKDWIDNSKKT